MITKTRIIAALLAAPAAIALASPAQAQVQGIATANPIVVLGNTKAFAAANQQIIANFKSNFDQLEAKEKARQPIVQQLVTKYDKNNDKNLDDAELQAAQNAKDPMIAQIGTIDQDMIKLNTPMIRAQGYAIEMIAQKYDAALQKVVADKKINLVLTPQSFAYAPAAVDVSAAITAEIDRTTPTVPVTVPANWQPQRQTAQLQQELQQFQQYQVMRAAAAQRAQQQGQGAAARPAGQPAAPAPAKPAEPR